MTGNLCPQTHGINGVTDENCPYCNANNTSNPQAFCAPVDAEIVRGEFEQFEGPETDLARTGNRYRHPAVHNRWYAFRAAYDRATMRASDEIEHLKQLNREMAAGVEVLTAERDEARGHVCAVAVWQERDRYRTALDAAKKVIADLRPEIERLRAEVRRAYDRGHHDCAMGVTEIPQEYRGADEASPPLAPDDSMRAISEVNLRRCLRWHPEGIDSWSLSDWAVALAGEVGELCDVVKKLNRARDGLTGNKLTEQQLWAELPKEAADIYLYLDLFCRRAKFDLPTAVRLKFDEVSKRNGFPERLGSQVETTHDR